MLNLLSLLAYIGGDAIITSHIHTKHAYPSSQLAKQHIFISATSFSTTTTMTTATAHPLNHSYNPHLFDVAGDVQPDGTSMVYQKKDKRTKAHRIDCGQMHSRGDAIPTPQIHGKPDCAISHSSRPSKLNNRINTIATTTSSITSFSTTTRTTATAHHLAHPHNVHVIYEMLGTQPDGMSVVYQFEDVFMAHRMTNPIKDMLMQHQMHHTTYILDGINTDGLDIAIKTMRANFMSITCGTYDQRNARLYTHSRPLRRLSTVSGELLLVVRKSWLYPSYRGRVDAGCYRIFVYFLSALQRAINFTQYHGVLATYTLPSITDGENIFIQRWTVPFFLQIYDGIFQLESDQGIGLRAFNTPYFAADISRSFSILKHRSIFWIILLCVCVCVFGSLFYFLHVALHDLDFSLLHA